MCINVLRPRTGQEVIPIGKKLYTNGSGSHGPSETSRHRPPTTLKLGNEDSQLRGVYTLPSFVVIRAV